MNATISVHGRFQPFHLGHMEYVRVACEQAGARKLVVGITQFQTALLRRVEDQAAAHRSERIANPMSFHERLTMVDIALTEANLGLEGWSIVPFPIEDPQELGDFVPRAIPVYTTTYDSWNVAKIRLLKDSGYHVVNLWDRDAKDFEGSDLRRRMIAGDESWRTLVSPAVATYLDELEISDRLRRAARAAADAGMAVLPELPPA